ncbi:hypothetical protein GCM10027596_27990 [Nocardioides korecus]
MPTSPSTSSRAGTHVLAGLLLALLAGLLLAPAAVAAPARSEGQLCTGSGVNVVVDYQSLGGGTVLACDASGAGKTAAQVFADAGVKITPVAAFPGAACRVNGKPAQGGCAKMPPADAYWGLYVDKGASWTYAPKGADELKTADGDFVAFSWQGTKSSTPPGVAPVKPTASASPSASASPAASSSASDSQQDNGLGVGFWVPALVVVLLVVAALVVLVRRRGRAGL